MSVWERKRRLMVEGIMPERTLLRFKRAGIAVYNAKKTQKNHLVFTVREKDIEKVFAIYPKVCYNRTVKSPYLLRDLGAVGIAKPLIWAKKRAGFLAGALLFCAATVFADSFVFGVEFVGTDVYCREVYAALEEYGVQPFSRYERKNEDLICARLLSLDGVEFCSVKKSGLRVVVEMRLSPFAKKSDKRGDMSAKHAGTLLSVTVIKGTALKKAGETVQKGEPLVGAYFLTESGEQKRVQAVARVSVACVYEADVQTETAEEAFAKGYLDAELSPSDTITAKSVEKRESAFHVKIEYTAIETFNL